MPNSSIKNFFNFNTLGDFNFIKVQEFSTNSTFSFGGISIISFDSIINLSLTVLTISNPFKSIFNSYDFSIKDKV